MLNKTELEKELPLIEQLFQRWIIGGEDAIPSTLIPPSWKSVLEGIDNERTNIALLALASQHQAFLTRTSPPEKLQASAPLPTLNLPTIEDKYRPAFRRALDSLEKLSIKKIGLLLRLLEQRGLTAHPSDLLPSSHSEDLPEIYWPWAQWTAHQAQISFSDHDAVTVENWDDWYPAERVKILQNMRISDSDATREIIRQCCSQEPAEKRLKIVKVLATNLNENDTDYLKELLNDRSQKITTFATQLLTRLDASPEPTETDTHLQEAKELADFFEVKKSGILSKRLTVLPRNLKSKKQQAVRTQLLEKVPVQRFAKSLGLSSEDLALAWQFLKNREIDNIRFVNNAIDHFSDKNIENMLNNLLEHLEKDDDLLSLIHSIIPRVDHNKRKKLMLCLLSNTKVTLRFIECLDYLEVPLSALEAETITQAVAWKNLKTNITNELKETGYLENIQTQQELLALGLFLPQKITENILHEILELGILRADPALDCLKLNTLITH